jgi:hypothetical protein
MSGRIVVVIGERGISWGREEVRASAEDSPARLNQSRPGPA